jgi:hypothetical protein
VEKSEPPISNQPNLKIHRNLYKNPKIAKLVLLYSRSLALQLCLLESGLKPNTFGVILKFSKRVSYVLLLHISYIACDF